MGELTRIEIDRIAKKLKARRKDNPESLFSAALAFAFFAACVLIMLALGAAFA
jgi:hypothetical protein